jgi:putative hydrolase of the HAD superfamily
VRKLPIKAVVFDLDDTLIDWSAQTLTYGEISRPHVAKMRDYLVTAVSTPLPDSDTFCNIYRQIIYEDWQAIQGTWEDMTFYNSLRRFFQTLGLDVTQIDFEAAMRAYDWQPVTQVKLYDDTLSTLELIRQKGYKIGLITNSMEPMWMRDVELEAYGLMAFLDARTTSGDVGYMKPHTAVFQHILTQLNTPAEQAVFVGDSPAHDIAGANNTGMISVLIDPPHLNRELNGTQPDFTINKLEELIPILETLT